MTHIIALAAMMAFAYGCWNFLLMIASEAKRGRAFWHFCLSTVVFFAAVFVVGSIEERRLSALQTENPAEYQSLMAAKAEEQRQAEEQERTREEARQQATLERQRSGRHCLSSWDGSPRRLVAAVKGSLRNPSSFEHIASSITPRNERGEHEVVMEYRAQNGFGGVSLGVATALVRSADCSVIEWSSI
ncbi:hypothetical protein [Mesorhizobium sp. KR1-2]|uniref:hypothetical protein n=1 Tax=Mesorhizobium sp. KR1-2 TaxID=3156609 RepID=UPI0032B4D36E